MSYWTIHPFRSYIAGILSIAITMALGAASGCANVPNRLNHIYDDANYEKAKSVVESFEAVTSERTGFQAKMLANLGAQKQLRETVAAESTRFFDQADMQMLRGVTWVDLRRELRSSLGWRPSVDVLQMLLATMNRINKDLALAQENKENSLKNGTIVANSFLSILGIKNEPRSMMRADLLNDWFETPAGQIIFAQPIYQISEQEISDVSEFTVENIQQLLRKFDPVEAGKFIDPGRWQLEEEESENFRSFGVRIIGHNSPDTQKTQGQEFLSLPKPRDGETALTTLAKVLHGEISNPDNLLLPAQISKRLTKLASALKMFEVLIKGERARNALLIAAEKRKLVEAGNKLGINSNEAGTKESGENTADNVIQAQDVALKLIFNLHKSISDFWRNHKQQKEFLGQANQLQRQLFLAADKSRDPAAVFSLVPIAGEGLIDDDLRILDLYLDHLKGINEEITKNLEELKKIGEEINEQNQNNQNEVMAMVREFIEAYGKFRNDNGEKESLGQILNEILKAADKLELDLKLASVEKVGKKLSDLEPALTTLIKNEGLDVAKVHLLLELVVGPNNLPKSDKSKDNLGKVFDAETVNEFQKLKNDVANESEVASKRVLNFLTTLQSLQKQLREESSRHYLALSGIARSEVERWEDIRSMSMNIKSLYKENKPGNLEIGKELLLFKSDGNCPNTIKEEKESQSTVCLSDDVISSIRRLAVTAHHFQTTVPQEVDADGEKAKISAERLARATEILQMYQLMTKFNRLRAAENSIALFGESQEHAIFIDNILVAGVESEVKYGLDSLAAFHGTGISQHDVDLFVGMVQSGLLLWIGSGVN